MFIKMGNDQLINLEEHVVQRVHMYESSSFDDEPKYWVVQIDMRELKPSEPFSFSMKSETTYRTCCRYTKFSTKTEAERVFQNISSAIGCLDLSEME